MRYRTDPAVADQRRSIIQGFMKPTIKWFSRHSFLEPLAYIDKNPVIIDLVLKGALIVYGQ